MRGGQHSPLPQVLARLAHDVDTPAVRASPTAGVRITGLVLCTLILVLVVLASTGYLL